MYLILHFLLIMTPGLPVEVNSATLNIKVEAIRSDKGQILVGLYTKAADWPREGGEYRQMRAKASTRGSSIVFKDLPPGEYAVALLHDENNDEKMNFNLLGIPKEGYGFSRNAKPGLKAPSFDKVKFRLASNETIFVKMQY